MSDRIDKDLVTVQAATRGRWPNDCDNRVFVAMPVKGVPFNYERLQVGELYADDDSALMAWAGNHAERYVTAARELRDVVAQQLGFALRQEGEQREMILKNTKRYVERILHTLEDA